MTFDALEFIDTFRQPICFVLLLFAFACIDFWWEAVE